MHRLDAGVTQLAECLLPKQNVVGSSPITRSYRDDFKTSCAELAVGRAAVYSS